MLLGSLLDSSFFWDVKVMFYIYVIYTYLYEYVIVGYSDIQWSRY